MSAPRDVCTCGHTRTAHAEAHMGICPVCPCDGFTPPDVGHTPGPYPSDAFRRIAAVVRDRLARHPDPQIRRIHRGDNSPAEIANTVEAFGHEYDALRAFLASLVAGRNDHDLPDAIVRDARALLARVDGS